jgi:hypothetical protein
MPRWAKGFVIAAVALVVLIVVMLLSGHGPGRHMHGLAPTPAQLGGVVVSATAAGSTAPW